MKVLCASFAATLALCAVSVQAELLCDCTQVVDACDASVSLEGSRVSIKSSSDSCSRVDYLIEGQPYTALIVGGSGELAGPAMPIRDATVVIENCRVCAENGATASAPAPESGEDNEDAGKPRALIKIMPDYPRRAYMNKLEGDVTVEFSVNQQGAVQNIKVVRSSSTLFDLAAIDAISRCKYLPAMQGDQPQVSSGIRERFSFRLLDGDTRASVTSVTE